MEKKLTPRKQQALEMRRKIQTAALDLFDHEGFENVSVEAIAQAAGCSVGNIYHYFKSKDELALQVTNNVDEAYRDLEQLYDDDTARPAIDKLMDFVGRTLRISVEDPVLYKAFIQAMKYPEQGTLRRSDKRDYFRILRKLVCLSRDEGALPADCDVDEIVEYLVTVHRGVLLEWRVYSGGFALEERGRKIVAAMLKGLK
ncbi:MAG: TetR/AcrR family transcriptional regulator [Oscillospiraceae bacterium]|nr:TetR/AcrR family transcriptional regulator [Oscillospiraceae bacterium]